MLHTVGMHALLAIAVLPTVDLFSSLYLVSSLAKAQWQCTRRTLNSLDHELGKRFLASVEHTRNRSRWVWHPGSA